MIGLIPNLRQFFTGSSGRTPIIVILMFLGINLGLAYYYSNLLKNEYVNSLSGQLSTLSQLVDESIIKWKDNQIETVEGVAMASVIKGATYTLTQSQQSVSTLLDLPEQTDLKLFFTQLARIYPEWTLRLVSPMGKVLSSCFESEIGTDVDPNLFSNAHQSPSTTFSIKESIDSSYPVVNIFSPVTDFRGNTGAYIWAEIDSKQKFSEIINFSDVGAGVKIEIFPLSRILSPIDPNLGVATIKVNQKMGVQIRVLKDRNLALEAFSPFEQLYIASNLILSTLTVILIAIVIISRFRFEVTILNEKTVAENANKLKDKFVSLVAHDLKNSLGTLVSYAELLEEPDNDPQTRTKITTRMVQSASKMMVMIDSLLSLGRLQSGKIKPDLKRVNAKSLVHQAIEVLRPLAEQKKIILDLQVPESYEVYCDEKLVSEVIQNLVSNSVKFCSPNDVIRIYTLSGNTAKLIIEDTGQGIAQEKLQQIFKYNEKTTTLGTLGEIGNGLGLPLSYDIMKAHNGHLRVESTLGKGSRFTLEFPDCNYKQQDEQQSIAA